MTGRNLTAFCALTLFAAAAPGQSLHLNLRSRVETPKGSGAWTETQLQRDLPARETALVICDLWDHHWCSGAEKRVGILAPKIAAVVERKMVLAIAPVTPPANLDIQDPKLPIDDREGGCETGEHASQPWPWSREHAAVTVAPQDAISEKGSEIYTLLRRRGIKNVLYTGVHTNFCILNRTFGIRQMTRWGVACFLVRDLTDSMYDPGKAPFVSHEEGTELVIRHIEKYWAPTVLSADLMHALSAAR
jgi:hypothetical protein